MGPLVGFVALGTGLRNDQACTHQQLTGLQRGRLRVIEVDGFKEWTWQLGRVHIIYGYRLRPIYDEQRNNLAGANIPFRAVDMDARPIISVRSGKDD